MYVSQSNLSKNHSLLCVILAVLIEFSANFSEVTIWIISEHLDTQIMYGHSDTVPLFHAWWNFTGFKFHAIMKSLYFRWVVTTLVPQKTFVWDLQDSYTDHTKYLSVETCTCVWNETNFVGTFGCMTSSNGILII